jgi:hypothetical protein
VVALIMHQTMIQLLGLLLYFTMMWSGVHMGHLLLVLVYISPSVWNPEFRAILLRRYPVDTRQWSTSSTSSDYALHSSIVSCLKTSIVISASLSLPRV